MKNRLSYSLFLEDVAAQVIGDMSEDPSLTYSDIPHLVKETLRRLGQPPSLTTQRDKDYIIKEVKEFLTSLGKGRVSLESWHREASSIEEQHSSLPKEEILSGPYCQFQVGEVGE